MKYKIHSAVLTVAVGGLLAASCKHTIQKPSEPVETVTNYPADVEKIIAAKCISCHNEVNAVSSGNVRMDTWEQLFNGGSNGAVVVPYDIENSSLLYFINTNEAYGPVALPTMPYDPERAPNTANPLTADEYLTIRNWIEAGAPDKHGNVPFGDRADSRQKIYITMQGCDLIGVVDAEKRVVMRYIRVGKSEANIETPHCVRFTRDGKYAFVSFIAGEYMQKIDVEKDSVVADVFVGAGSWNVFHLSPDGKRMLMSNWQGNGSLLLINTETMQIEERFQGPNEFVFPHGVTSNSAFNVFYVTAEFGNTIYKLNMSTGNKKEVSLDGNPPVTVDSLMNPHEIIMVPDESRYFVTCGGSNDVRVMDAVADTLIKIIPVGLKPQEIAISTTRPYVFVTCMEDNSNLPGFRGSVYAINYNTYQATRIDGPFFQPHGITVDDQNGTFYVVSRNFDTDGPAPHHSSSCAGRNGYYHVYDLNTFQRLPKRFEVTVEPYSADTRFK